jgi:hypothetical protein
MGAPFRRSDNDKPSRAEPKTEPKSEPLKNAPAKDTPGDFGAAPSFRATEMPDPPWMRKPRGGVFEGDVAAVELRSWLAQVPERIPEPAVLYSKAPRSSRVLRLMRGVVMVAAVAGVGGYFWGWRASTKIPERMPASGQASVVPALSTLGPSLETSNRDFGPAPARTAAIGPARVDTRGAANPVPSVDAAQRPALLPPQTGSPSVDPPPPVVAEDASVIAARMRTRMRAGVELVTYGEVATARKIFQLAAEAGEAAGAFALAETYDPLELAAMRLREEIKPDVALARTWYERARNLGSLDARDRLSRLAQIPQ